MENLTPQKSSLLNQCNILKKSLIQKPVLTKLLYSDIHIIVMSRRRMKLSNRNLFASIVGKLVVLSIVVLGIGLGSSAFATSAGGDRLDIFGVPTTPGDIRLAGIDGKMISLSDYAGKVVILNFWKKDCPYCVVEKESLKEFVRKFNPSDVKIIGVDLWDDPSWIRNNGSKYLSHMLIASRMPGKKAFVENVVRGRLMGYYVINEANEAVFEIKAFPSTYVLDRQGKVVAGHTGMVNWMSQSIHDTMSSFLKTDVVNNNKIDPTDEGIGWLNKLMSFPRQINVSLLK